MCTLGNLTIREMSALLLELRSLSGSLFRTALLSIYRSYIDYIHIYHVFMNTLIVSYDAVIMPYEHSYKHIDMGFVES